MAEASLFGSSDVTEGYQVIKAPSKTWTQIDKLIKSNDLLLFELPKNVIYSLSDIFSDGPFFA